MITLSRFEVARIIGARSLQISLGAPVLVKDSESMFEPLEIACAEYENGAIPITVRRG